MSELHIANPKRISRFIHRMAFVAISTVVLAYLGRDYFVTAFMSNVLLNGTILFVFVVGCIFCFFYVFNLREDVAVVARLDEILFDSKEDNTAPLKLKMHLMKSTVIRLNNNVSSGEFIKLSLPASRALIDGMQDNLDEEFTVIRYFTDLLIFIGLIGTFLGLTITIGAIGGILSDLAAGLGGQEDIMLVMAKLIRGLEGPLQGMSTAFGSSLMGLSTSLVLGVLLLHLKEAGCYFTSAMESWLAQHTIEHLGDITGKSLQPKLQLQTQPQAQLQALNNETSLAPVASSGQVDQVTLQLNNIAGILQKMAKSGAIPDAQWQRLSDQNRQISETVKQVSDYIKTMSEFQSNQLTQTELQLKEAEKLRQLFTTQTNASVEALGAVHESKQRLVQIVSSLLDEQGAQHRSQEKSTEQVAGIKEMVEECYWQMQAITGQVKKE